MPTTSKLAQEKEYREQTADWFSEQVKRELDINASKGLWLETNPYWLLNRAHQETDELFEAMKAFDKLAEGGVVTAEERVRAREALRDIISEAADATAFHMMIADQARSVIRALDAGGVIAPHANVEDSEE